MSDRHKKAKAALLSAVMVLSVISIGGVALTGSAAAVTTAPDSTGTLDAVADDALADSNTNKTHTISLRTDPTNFSGTSGNNTISAINVSYDNSVDVSSISNIDVYVNGTSVAGGNTGNQTDANAVNITALDIGDTATYKPESNELLLTVDIDGVGNPSGDTGVTTDLLEGDTGNSPESTVSGTLSVGSGPVDLDGIPYSTLHGAVEDLSAAGETVTVENNVELSGVQDHEVDIAQNGVTVTSDSSATVTSPANYSQYDAQIGQAIDLSADNVTIDSLNLNGNDLAIDGIADKGPDGTFNSTISDNLIENFAGSYGIDVQADDDSTSKNLQLNVSGNNVSSMDGDGIRVDASKFNGGERDSIDISNNDISLDSGDTGLLLSDTNSNTEDVDVTISETTVEGSSQSGTGISVADTNNFDDEVDITGGLINNTDTGIATANAPGAFLNISGVEVTNFGTDGINVNQNASSGTTVNVDSVIINSASGTNGILIPDSGNAPFSVDVNNATINGTSDGIAYNQTSSSGNQTTVTDSTITNTSNAIVFGGAGDDVDVTAHFNELTDNTNGVVVAADIGVDARPSLTFNDIFDNENDGLRVNTGPSNKINANYSYWGDREYSRIISTYSPQNTRLVDGQVRSVYEYTRIHTEGRR